MNKRTIGFHPCVGKKASGEERPTMVVIRTSDGKHEAHEFDEQQLLDFFTCGAVVAWRDATVEDRAVARPAHHCRWVESDAKARETFVATNPAIWAEEREQLFRIVRKKLTGEITGTFRLHVPYALVALDPATDTVGVANGGLGFQIMDMLLGRYPAMDVRVIGSGTLKESRLEFDALLPKTIRKKAEKLRATATDSDADAVDSDDSSGSEEDDNSDPKLSKSAAKDANAKFDAHRIAYALADETAAQRFHQCTLRDRDWAAVAVTYADLERARKGRVAEAQRFRQLHRAETRRLVRDSRVPYVTRGTGDEDDQSIDALLASYEETIRISVTDEVVVAAKVAKLRAAYGRIVSARTDETEMERHLEDALQLLPEYTEFLSHVKATVDPETGLPLGKYIGTRIFGRLIAGFGSPMSTRIHEPVRPADAERIAACKCALTQAIAAIDRTDLPAQPPIGGGKTREWLLACERIVREREDQQVMESDAEVQRTYSQSVQIAACRDAYRKLVNAKKRAEDRPLNRAIAYMGLHVRQGGKYAGTPKEHEFPRRRKGARANWNEELLRQAIFQWVTGIIRGGKGEDSYWKVHTFQPTKDRRIANGVRKGDAHKDAFWRTATVATRWLLRTWFRWEQQRAAAVTIDAAA